MPISNEVRQTIVPELENLMRLDPYLRQYEGEIRRR